MSKRECLLCGKAWEGGGPPDLKCPHCGDHAVRVISPRGLPRLKGPKAILLIVLGTAMALLGVIVPASVILAQVFFGPVQTPQGPGERVTVEGVATVAAGDLLVVQTGDHAHVYVTLDPAFPRPGFLENRRVRVRAVRIIDGPEKGNYVQGRVIDP